MIGRFFRTLKMHLHASTLNVGGEGADGKLHGSSYGAGVFLHDPVLLQNIISTFKETWSRVKGWASDVERDAEREAKYKHDGRYIPKMHTEIQSVMQNAGTHAKRKAAMCSKIFARAKISGCRSPSV